jgi:hypothetical protein
MCNTGRFDTSNDHPPHCEPDIVGFLCVLGGSVCYATAPAYAEHQGMCFHFICILGKSISDLTYRLCS